MYRKLLSYNIACFIAVSIIFDIDMISLIPGDILLQRNISICNIACYMIINADYYHR